MAVQIDRKRQREAANRDLVTPHGTEITVTASRAEQLLKRDALPFGDGKYRKYAESGESNVVEMSTTRANAPRKGSGENTPGGK